MQCQIGTGANCVNRWRWARSENVSRQSAARSLLINWRTDQPGLYTAARGHVGCANKPALCFRVMYLVYIPKRESLENRKIYTTYAMFKFSFIDYWYIALYFG